MSQAKSDSAHCAVYGSGLFGIQVRRKRTTEHSVLSSGAARLSMASREASKSSREATGGACPRDYKDDIVAGLCETAVWCRMPLTRLEPKYRDTAADEVCL
jgi:hypothetical protein